MRIIPARAGFTRGTDWDLDDGRGSSPLARGLRDHHEPPGQPCGIIPARAGFTWRDWFATLIALGSSPLARGLHADAHGWYLPARIIPARAGFTPAIWAAPRRARDHPRSRGVYGVDLHHLGEVEGSSPLARGLRRDVRKRHRLNRIIPARAGFTSLRSGRMLPPRDHPRSRGVYYSGPERCTRGEGSSPLARGLPWADSTWGCSTGIIPARAGFTTNASESSQGSQDHPRSRGVY